MGNFANTLFSVLLGWAQSAVAGLWQLVSADGADGLTGWILDHWLALAIGLCVIGAALDFLVYLFRWQPYRVWVSFLRRNEPDEPEASGESEVEPLQWVYATGETVYEPAEEPVAAYDEPEIAPMPGQRVIPARRRRVQAYGDASAEIQQGYYQPYYPPQWGSGDRHMSDGGMRE